MKIVNNKIYIIRGETPTYDNYVISRDNGAPYMINPLIQDLREKNVWVEFVVRPSIYSRGDDFVFRTYMLIKGNHDHNKDVHLFPSRTVVDYSTTGATDMSFWDDTKVPHTGNEDLLHVRRYSGVNYYAYYGNKNYQGIFRLGAEYQMGDIVKYADDYYKAIAYEPDSTIIPSSSDDWEEIEDVEFEWIDYDFRISFQFPFEYTSVMENKTYKYEISIVSGFPESEYGEVIPETIDYKEPLMEATDFVVGGSLSE